MSETVIVLLAIQVGLSGVLVIGLLLVGRSLMTSLNKATVLMESVQSAVESEVRPTMQEARIALAKAEQAVTHATVTLTKAEPALTAIGALVSKANQRANPLWLDAAKFGFGLFRAIRNGRHKANQKGELTHGNI